MLIAKLLAAGGLVFAFGHATIAGKAVLSLLAVVSIFSWSIMITKLRVIRFARQQNARFLAAFRQDRQPLRLFEKNARFPGSPGDRGQDFAGSNGRSERGDGTRRG